MSEQKPCESCGRCPTCGKGAFTAPFYPGYPEYYFYPYHVVPYWQQTWATPITPYTVWSGATTTGYSEQWPLTAKPKS